MRFKKGVSLRGINWRMWWASTVAEEVYEAHGYGPLVVTSGSEGVHKHATHGLGYGVDWRNRDIPKTERGKIRNEIAARLGRDYDVVEESNPDHFHCEFDPRIYLGGVE